MHDDFGLSRATSRTQPFKPRPSSSSSSDSLASGSLPSSLSWGSSSSSSGSTTPTEIVPEISAFPPSKQSPPLAALSSASDSMLAHLSKPKDTSSSPGISGFTEAQQMEAAGPSQPSDVSLFMRTGSAEVVEDFSIRWRTRKRRMELKVNDFKSSKVAAEKEDDGDTNSEEFDEMRSDKDEGGTLVLDKKLRDYLRRHRGASPVIVKK
ncbi:unnamed protein product [Gongylonema pulchrum]|uniref:HUN domain-containing protein n=1 Tax=Gongylonema pulchrum TaxID=637853 RepID=A0A183E5T1_9BILA|nr:unnamed protein product [Gongylonema pulchrum]